MGSTIGNVQSCATIVEARRHVDALDDFPVPLLTERGDYMTQAARIKNDPDPMRDEYHIETIIARVRERAVTEGDQPEVIVTIYRAMIEAHIACGHRELARLQAGI